MKITIAHVPQYRSSNASRLRISANGVNVVGQVVKRHTNIGSHHPFRALVSHTSVGAIVAGSPQAITLFLRGGTIKILSVKVGSKLANRIEHLGCLPRRAMKLKKQMRL